MQALHERVVGQDQAVEAVADAIQRCASSDRSLQEALEPLYISWHDSGHVRMCRIPRPVLVRFSCRCGLPRCPQDMEVLAAG